VRSSKKRNIEQLGSPVICERDGIVIVTDDVKVAQPRSNVTGFEILAKGSEEISPPGTLRASATPPASGRSAMHAVSVSPAVVRVNSSHRRTLLDVIDAF
jgi:hypothetical protein